MYYSIREENKTNIIRPNNINTHEQLYTKYLYLVHINIWRG